MKDFTKGQRLLFTAEVKDCGPHSFDVTFVEYLGDEEPPHGDEGRRLCIVKLPSGRDTLAIDRELQPRK